MGVGMKENTNKLMVLALMHELMNAEEEEDRGLGYMSKQAFEAIHSDMKRKWEQGLKVSTSSKTSQPN